MVQCTFLDDVQEIMDGVAHLFFWCKGLHMYYYPNQFPAHTQPLFCYSAWQLVDETRQTLRNQDYYIFNSTADLLKWALEIIVLCQSMC